MFFRKTNCVFFASTPEMSVITHTLLFVTQHINLRLSEFEYLMKYNYFFLLKFLESNFSFKCVEKGSLKLYVPNPTQIKNLTITVNHCHRFQKTKFSNVHTKTICLRFYWNVFTLDRILESIPFLLKACFYVGE